MIRVGELIGVATSEKNGLLTKTKYDAVIETNLSTYLSDGVFIFDTGLKNGVDQYVIFEISHLESAGYFEVLNLLLTFINGRQVTLKKDGTYDRIIKVFVYNNTLHLYFEVSNAFARFSIKVKTSSQETIIKKTDLKAIPDGAEFTTVAS